MTVRRNGAETQVKIKPVKGTDGSSKLGVWVRDDTQGIGTVTYMDLNGNLVHWAMGSVTAIQGNWWRLPEEIFMIPRFWELKKEK